MFQGMKDDDHRIAKDANDFNNLQRLYCSRHNNDYITLHGAHSDMVVLVRTTKSWSVVRVRMLVSF